MRASPSELTVTIVYDNRSEAEELDPAWGFACVVEGLAKTILFDTGGDGPTLLRNMDALGFKPQDMDMVVLSHAHWDHTGGLKDFLKANSDVAVYTLQSFPDSIADQARRRGARVVVVSKPAELCAGAMVTGEIVGESGIPEQSLLLQGNAGAAVITGCAHPGVVRIVRRAKEFSGTEVRVVLGGFHLVRDAEDSIDRIISDLKRLGVRQAVPCHCSGDRALELFASAYGTELGRCSVGTVVPVGGVIGGRRGQHQEGIA